MAAPQSSSDSEVSRVSDKGEEGSTIQLTPQSASASFSGTPRASMRHQKRKQRDLPSATRRNEGTDERTMYVVQLVAEQEAKYDAKLKDQRTEYEIKLKDERDRGEAKGKEYEAKLEAKAKDYEAKLAALVKDHEAKLMARLKDHEAALEVVRQACDRRTEALLMAERDRSLAQLNEEKARGEKRYRCEHAASAVIGMALFAGVRYMTAK